MCESVHILAHVQFCSLHLTSSFHNENAEAFCQTLLNSLVQRNSIAYSNFTPASSTQNLYSPSYLAHPCLAGIVNLTCLKQRSLCFSHPPISALLMVSPILAKGNSILPANAVVSFLLSLSLALANAVCSASIHVQCLAMSHHLHCYHHGPSPHWLSPG